MTSLSAFTTQLFTNAFTAQQSQLGVLRITGVDGKKFLQGQATCDTNKLSPSQSLYGAICNIKGRIITNFYLLQEEQDLLLLMDKALVEKTLLHLKKYAVFFKVALLDASAEFHIQASFTPATQVVQLNTLSEIVATQSTQDTILLQVAEQPINIQWQIHKSHHDAITEKPSDQAAALSLLAARPLITLEQSENILPQWLNMQGTGGISFTKGCYTGQEIVARMQYRGKSKKQLALFTWQGQIDHSQDIQNQAGQTIGQIFNLSCSQQTYVAQAILNVEPDEVSQFLLDAKEITLLPLPYALNKEKTNIV